MILKDLIPLDEILDTVADKRSLDFVIEQDFARFKSQLTKKQLYVLDKIIEGYKQYEIAKLMGVSNPSITKHKKLIAKKIKVWIELTR